MRFMTTIDTDGPQTRAELCDAMKAYHALTTLTPRSIYIPMKTYIAWTKWTKDEQGVEDKDVPPFTMAGVPSQVMGMYLYIANEFRMG